MSLLSENYVFFVLTEGFISAGIYHTDSGKFSILILIVMPEMITVNTKSHSQGNRVLSEVCTQFPSNTRAQLVR